MDIISAYREVGTYRGAAAICGTTPKTVKRVIARHESGGAALARQPRGRNYDEVSELVAERVDKTQGQDHREAVAAGRPGRGLRRVGPQLPAAGRGAESVVAPRQPSWPAAGGVVPGRASGHRLGCAGRAARVLRGAGLVRVPVRALRRQRARRHDVGDAGGVLRGPRRGPETGAGRSDGLPEGRRGRERGGPHRGLCAVRVPLPVPARLLRGRRPGVQGHRGEPGRLRQDRPDDPGADGSGDPFADLGAANTAAAAWCAEVNAAVHSEICAVPAERLAIERELLAALPSLRAEIGQVDDPQGRPALLRPVRLGALLGPDPADRRPGPVRVRPRPVLGDPRRAW